MSVSSSLKAPQGRGRVRFCLPFSASLLAGAIALVSQGVAAQEPAALQKVVVSAAGFEQKITDAPASISVIDKEELAKRPYMTLLDAVRDLEGVDIGETRDKTGQGTISMRGMGADYTLILVNGRRVSNHGDIYPNSFQGNQFNHIPPLDAIERIEVIRGPAATLYGADALGGVINIITRRNADKWSGSVTVSRTVQEESVWGDDTTVDLFVTGPLIANVLTASLRGSWYNRDESNPTYSSVTDPAGGVHNRSLTFGGGGKTVDNTNIAAGFNLVWTPTKEQTISLDYDTSHQEYDNKIKINDAGNEEYPVGTVDTLAAIWSAGNYCSGATGSNAAACTGNGGTWSRRSNPRAGYAPEQEFTRDAWSLTHEGNWNFGKSFISLAHVATNNDGRTMPFTVAERRHLLEMIDATGAYAGMSLSERQALAESTFLPRPKRTLESAQTTLDARLDLPYELAGQHMAIIGAQVIRGELTDGVFGMEEGQTGGVQDHNLWALFVEDTWYVTEPLAITAGVRHDDHDTFGSHLSPRLYGVYTLNDQWTFKGGVTTGYKAPKTTQLYDGIVGFGGQGVSPSYGNPNLKPETSVSTEVAAYWQHPVQRHNFNITAFENKFEDKIQSGQPCGGPNEQPCHSSGEFGDLGYADGSTRTGNIDEAVVKGVEVAGRYQILDNLGFRANYTYTDSEQTSGTQKGQPLTNTAKHMANATLEWQPLNKLSVFLTAELRQDRYRSWNDGNPLYWKDYEIFHLGASYQLFDNVTLNARINNLLDEDFTTYDPVFTLGCTTAGSNCVIPPGETEGYSLSATDHYNNKDKARNFWVSVNVRF